MSLCFLPLAPTVAPMNITIDRYSATEMGVSWEPLTLEQARGFVSAYVIGYEPAGDTKRQQIQPAEVGGDQTSVNIPGLIPGVAYSVSVSASTSAGMGTTSTPIDSPGKFQLLECVCRSLTSMH